MLTVTFIRHGESEDNLLPIWAGWRDAPLSELGQKQAAALGQYLASTRINVIHSSDLKRAHSTAKAVQAAQQSPAPPIHVTTDLREMNFGRAEGNPWMLQGGIKGLSDEELEKRCAEQNVYLMIHERDKAYPDGESLEDVARRADKVIQEVVLPYLIQSTVGDDQSLHVALTSHGLCISELVPALLRLDPEAAHGEESFAGLHNTAWYRATVELRDPSGNAEDPNTGLPPLKVAITHRNVVDHYKLIDAEVPANEGADGARAEARLLSTSTAA